LPAHAYEAADAVERPHPALLARSLLGLGHSGAGGYASEPSHAATTVVGIPSEPQPPGRERACSPDPRPALGRLGEQLAAEHLERNGFAILARRERTGAGEIDVIAFDGTTLVFAEVKARRRSARSR